MPEKSQRAPSKSVWRFWVNNIHTIVYTSCLGIKFQSLQWILTFSLFPQKGNRRKLFFLSLMYSLKIHIDFSQVFTFKGRSCNSYYMLAASCPGMLSQQAFRLKSLTLELRTFSLARADTATFGLFITSHSRVYKCGNPPFPPSNQQLWLNPGRKGWEVCEYIAHQWLKSQNFREKISDGFF